MSKRNKLLVKGPWDKKANLDDFTGWVPPQTDGQGWTYYKNGKPQSIGDNLKNIAKLTINHLKKSSEIHQAKKRAQHKQGNEAIGNVLTKVGQVFDPLIDQPGTFGTSKSQHRQKTKELDKSLENEYGW